MNQVLKMVGAAVLFVALPIDALAANHKVLMKNTGSDGQPMQFEPAFLKIARGDTVTLDAGHVVQSIPGLSPEGTEPWISNLNQELTVTFSAEGLHADKCSPHLL